MSSDRFGDWSNSDNVMITKRNGRSGTGKKRKVRGTAREDVNWRALEGALDAAEDDILQGILAVQQRQIPVVVREVLRRADRLEEVDEVGIPYRDQVVEVVEEGLQRLYKIGQRETTNEINLAFKRSGLIKLAKAPRPDDSVNQMFLRTRARTLANTVANRLKRAAVMGSLDLYRQGNLTAATMTSLLEELSDNVITSEIRLISGETLNFGRDLVAAANGDDIKYAEYSALLDPRTCEYCKAHDEVVFEYGSPEMKAHTPPLSTCLGRNRCRCVLVYVMEEEL